MRQLSLLYDLLVALLFALLVGWVVHFHVRSLPTDYVAQKPYINKDYPPDLDFMPGSRYISKDYTPDLDFSLPDGMFDFPELPDFRVNPKPPPRLRPAPPEHVADVVNSIYAQSKVTHSYQPAYVKLAYPGGDVDESTGVCTDVVIRAFRAEGIDLQKAVHEDMRKHFRKYPQKWRRNSPDSNIDHRRVLNLMTFFERKGKSLPVSNDPADYQPGDVVAWALNDTQQHIGVVMAERSEDEERPLVGHNINQGAQIEDVLFEWPIIGHYRYFDAKLAKD